MLWYHGRRPLKDVVPHRGKARRPAHGDPSRILARQQKVVAIKVDQPHADAFDDGSDIGIPLREDVIAVFHQPSVLDDRSRPSLPDAWNVREE